jgi:hypothetical protein
MTLKQTKLLLVFSLTFALCLTTLASVSLAQADSTSVQIVPAQTNVAQGQTCIVDVTISNVQNLYGLDVSVTWNSSALQILGINTNLGVESNQGGILHTAQGADLVIAVNDSSQAAGQWHLVATSVNPADSFNGSGTIATLTFNVTSPGQTNIRLTSTLSSRPAPDEVSETIEHNNIPATVTVSVIPEFPQVALIAVAVASATVILAYGKRKANRNI